jgi:FKBP-type peptidyl-prolyl cis-trans isomerase FkpA
MSKFIQFSVFILAGALLFGCKKDEILSPEAQLAKDVEKIQDYLTDNNLTAQSTASGLHYIVEVEGDGNHPTINDKVTVFYKGYFLDGKVFDQTGANPVTFPLTNVITGWQEGIPLFKKGGKGKLFLPSGLAYGSYPPNGIPKNAVMIFDVELVNF